MKISNKKLLSEINNVLPYSCSAVESNSDDRAIYVRCNSLQPKQLEQLKTKILNHLKALPYMDENVDIISRVTITQKPVLDGFYVFVWGNKEDEKNFLMAKLTLETESLLDIKKQELVSREKMLITVKALAALKD